MVRQAPDLAAGDQPRVDAATADRPADLQAGGPRRRVHPGRGRDRGTDSPFGAVRSQGTATGSGFVVDKDGTIVTNAHVVEGASKVTVSFEEGGDAIDAEVKGIDTDSDIAVLKIDPSGQVT